MYLLIIYMCYYICVIRKPIRLRKENRNMKDYTSAIEGTLQEVLNQLHDKYIKVDCAFGSEREEVKSNYRNIIRIGAVELYYLLKFTEPVAYTSGVYGWNADVYDFDNVAIVMGYRPFGNISPDYNIVEKIQ